jgi:hypothetical protein
VEGWKGGRVILPPLGKKDFYFFIFIFASEVKTPFHPSTLPYFFLYTYTLKIVYKKILHNSIMRTQYTVKIPPEIDASAEKIVDNILNGFKEYQMLYEFKTLPEFQSIPINRLNLIVTNLTYYYLYLSYYKFVVTDVNLNDVADADYLNICNSCKVLNENFDPQIICNLSFKLLFLLHRDAEKTEKVYKIIQDVATKTMQINHDNLPLIKIIKETIL